MAWTTPRTWATNELVTAALLNEQLRDNVNHLLEKANSQLVFGSGTNFTTTSTTLVDVTGFSTSFTKISSNSRLIVVLQGTMVFAGGLPVPAVAINVNGTDYDSGCQQSTGVVIAMLNGIAAGSYTIKMRMKAVGGGNSIFNGGTERRMLVTESL